jgi:hypothetical protein
MVIFKIKSILKANNVIKANAHYEKFYALVIPRLIAPRVKKIQLIRLDIRFYYWWLLVSSAIKR